MTNFDLDRVKTGNFGEDDLRDIRERKTEEEPWEDFVFDSDNNVKELWPEKESPMTKMLKDRQENYKYFKDYSTKPERRMHKEELDVDAFGNPTFQLDPHFSKQTDRRHYE